MEYASIGAACSRAAGRSARKDRVGSSLSGPTMMAGCCRQSVSDGALPCGEGVGICGEACTALDFGGA